MKKYILVLGLILSIAPTFAQEGFIEANYKIKDGYSDFTCKNAVDKIDVKNLEKAEYKILGKIFKDDTTEVRLSRIEAKIFGSIQSGSFSKRMDMINKYSNKCLIAAGIGVMNMSVGGFGPSYGGYYGGYRGYRGYRGYGHHHNCRCNRWYNNGFWNRRPYGTLTGFTPPVGYSYYNNYGYTNGIYNNPNYYYREGIIDKIKNAFKKDDENNDPYYSTVPTPQNNGIVNGNYNNAMQGQSKTINLFDDNNGTSAGDYQNGYGYEGRYGSNGGATVTIID